MSLLRITALLTIAGWALCLMAADLSQPRLEVFKTERRLRLYDGEKLVQSWPIALGRQPLGTKEKEGDGATPEGTYFICMKNPLSKFHLSLGLSYPGPADAERGRRAGLITAEEFQAIVAAHESHTAPPWHTALGGEIFVHGHGSSPDWTKGCIALDDEAMEELYALVPLGTPITIHP